MNIEPGTVTTSYIRMRKRFGHIVEFFVPFRGDYKMFYQECTELQKWAWEYVKANPDKVQQRRVRKDKRSRQDNVAQMGFLTAEDAMLARLIFA